MAYGYRWDIPYPNYARSKQGCRKPKKSPIRYDKKGGDRRIKPKNSCRIVKTEIG